MSIFIFLFKVQKSPECQRLPTPTPWPIFYQALSHSSEINSALYRKHHRAEKNDPCCLISGGAGKSGDVDTAPWDKGLNEVCQPETWRMWSHSLSSLALKWTQRKGCSDALSVIHRITKFLHVQFLSLLNRSSSNKKNILKVKRVTIRNWNVNLLPTFSFWCAILLTLKNKVRLQENNERAERKHSPGNQKRRRTEETPVERRRCSCCVILAKDCKTKAPERREFKSCGVEMGPFFIFSWRSWQWCL